MPGITRYIPDRIPLRHPQSGAVAAHAAQKQPPEIRHPRPQQRKQLGYAHEIRQHPEKKEFSEWEGCTEKDEYKKRII